MRKIIPFLALSLISGCMAEIKTDRDHQYKEVRDFYKDKDPHYLVSIGKDESTFLLEDRISMLNAISRAKGRSLNSVCREADSSGDHIIDSAEYVSFMRKTGRFEALMY